jgi:hypothetical protein
MQEIITSGFSDQYLNLTKDFCCDTGNLKLIRWIGCKPGVYKGAKTVFTSDDLALCPWFQVVENYSYTTFEFAPGDLIELQLSKILFLFGKTKWEDGALDSLKQLEVGLNQQGGVIGSMIPFNIETPNPERYNFSLIRDLLEINTSSQLNGNMIINNCSPYTVTLSLLYAY